MTTMPMTRPTTEVGYTSRYSTVAKVTTGSHTPPDPVPGRVEVTFAGERFDRSADDDYDPYSARACGDTWALMAGLNVVGGTAIELGDLMRARATYEEAVALAREQGDVTN